MTGQPAFVFETDSALALSCGDVIREVQIAVDVVSLPEGAVRLAREREYGFALIRLAPDQPRPGIEVASTVRGRSDAAHIVLVSTSVTRELQSHAMNLPRAEVLEVPRDPERFLDLVRRRIMAWSTHPGGSPPPPPHEVRRPPTTSISLAADRRHETRFHVDPVHVEIHQKRWIPYPFSGANTGRRLVDLSTGGVSVVCTEPLDPGAKVRIKIHLDRFDDEIELPGEVRRCTNNGRSVGEYLIGAHFIDVDAAQARKLKRIAGLFTSAAYAALEAAKHRPKE